MMGRAGYSDSRVCHNIDIRISRLGKAMVRIDAQIHFVMSIGDGEGLRQFAWAGAKPLFVINTAAFLHQPDAASWLDRANQNKTVGGAFHQHVQHPMGAVTKINVGRAGLVSFDKCARGGT